MDRSKAMLRHKKKKEEKAAAAANAVEQNGTSANDSLFGIGGVRVKKDSGKSAQRQTAAEIRVQRGKSPGRDYIIWTSEALLASNIFCFTNYFSTPLF